MGRTKRIYRSGRKRVVTEHFKNEVTKRLAARGKPASWLEAQLGIGTGALHQLLHRNQTSIYVDKICAVLGIRGPVDENDGLAEMATLFESLNRDGQLAALAMLRGLAASDSISGCLIL